MYRAAVCRSRRNAGQAATATRLGGRVAAGHARPPQQQPPPVRRIGRGGPRQAAGLPNTTRHAQQGKKQLQQTRGPIVPSGPRATATAKAMGAQKRSIGAAHAWGSIRAGNVQGRGAHGDTANGYPRAPARGKTGDRGEGCPSRPAATISHRRRPSTAAVVETPPGPHVTYKETK